MRCDYAHDDGAYVLGALAPAERSAYERHLANCPACREAVAEIAVLPGLLGRLDSATALQLLATEQPADGMPAGSRMRPVAGHDDGDSARVSSLLERAAAAKRRDRRKNRMRYAGAMLAAACLALVAMLGVGALRGELFPGGGSGTGDVRLEAMTPAAAQLPVHAEVGLRSRPWGTEVTMECAYEQSDRYRKSWRVHLVAYGANNETEQVGSWIAAPGQQVSFTGITRFSSDELEKLALVRPDGTTLLTYDVS